MPLPRTARAGLAAFVVALAAGSACTEAGTRDGPATATRSGAGSELPSPLPLSTRSTYYVSARGRDSNPGTLRRPWRTIQHALDRLRPGERALIRAGTYVQDLVARRAGTVDAPITIAAYPGERVVLQPASMEGDTYPIVFTSKAAYIRLSRFVIEGADGTSSTNVYFEGSAHHIELSGSEIRDSQDQGVFAERTTSDLQILRNRIHDNGLRRESGQHQSHGVYIEGAGHLIANNLIYNHPYGFGIQIYPMNHDTIVVNNTVVESGHAGIVVGGEEGVFNIAIRNNILAFNAKYGIQMDSNCPTGPVAVDTNVIFGNRHGPLQGGCSTVDASGGNIVADPRFMSRERRIFRIAQDSPAVDRARPDYAPRTDILGARRPRGTGYDIGAFELVK